jgi:DNA-binding MarR family transcriptional regulator
MEEGLIEKLPESAHTVIEALAEHGTLNQKKLRHYTGLPLKTIRYAINRLEKYNIVVKTPNLEDMRSPKLSLNPDFNAEQFIENIKKPIKVKQ